MARDLDRERGGRKRRQRLCSGRRGGDGACGRSDRERSQQGLQLLDGEPPTVHPGYPSVGECRYREISDAGAGWLIDRLCRGVETLVTLGYERVRVDGCS